MPCHARMPACMNTCMHECMHACMYVRRWGACRNRCALALGTMKRGAYGPIGMAWQSIAVLTCLPLQSRSKKLVQSKVMETSGCSLMEFRSLMILRCTTIPPGQKTSKEQSINSDNDLNKQQEKGQARQPQESLFLSVECTLVVLCPACVGP